MQFVSEQALAETYDAESGWETVAQYRDAVRLRENNPDMARAEIARRVDRSQSAVRGWLGEDKVPRVLKGLEIAQDRGWIDVDTESECFRALNQLVAWIFSGGGISAETFTPHFSVDDPLMLATLSHSLRWLQIDYRYRDSDDPERSMEVVPGEGAAVLGRVLSTLGAPRGVKAQQDNLALPGYLSSVDREHRRDFARIYLLNRGHDLSDTGGVSLLITPSTLHSSMVRDLFESSTSGSAILKSESRVRVSANAVHDLAGATPVRSALAMKALHGSVAPPTVRSIASTFRRSKTPQGYRYHQLYQTVADSEKSRSALASETELPQSTIQSWRRGGAPYATSALRKARERGWVAPPPSSETSLALTALLTWLFARGSLRETYFPIFQARSTAQQEYFASIADTLELSYTISRADDPDRPTELRPTEDGSLLGRVLYSLGALRRNEAQTTAPFPPLVHHHPDHAQKVADIWCLHYATGGDESLLRLSTPPRKGQQLRIALATLLSESLSWTIGWQTDGEIVVTATPDNSTISCSL